MAYKRTVWASENMPDFKNGLNRIEDELVDLDKKLEIPEDAEEGYRLELRKVRSQKPVKNSDFLQDPTIEVTRIYMPDEITVDMLAPLFEEGGLYIKLTMEMTNGTEIGYCAVSRNKIWFHENMSGQDFDIWTVNNGYNELFVNKDEKGYYLHLAFGEGEMSFVISSIERVNPS